MRIREAVTLVLALFICLFAGTLGSLINFLAPAVYREIGIIFNDREVQWLIALLLTLYIAAFVVLRWQTGILRQSLLISPTFWLMCFVAVGVIVYAIGYSSASQSNQAVTMLFGIAAGLAVRGWIERKISERQSGEPLFSMIAIMVFLLSVAALWRCHTGGTCAYKGELRWEGPWESPNVYGILMATGILLALGSGSGIRFFASTKIPKWVWASSGLTLVAAMGLGLLRSYSRGAWLAAICGLGYLGYQRFNLHLVLGTERFRGNVFSAAIVVLSLIFLVFGNSYHPKWRLADRAISIANANDFSWRNRIAAWEGALQIAADHPWLGAGWVRSELLYEHYYLNPKLDEHGAIEMNDHLMVVAMLGVPALICFELCVWLSLTRNCDERVPLQTCPDLDAIRKACRAGAIALAVSFWFDGGLFLLPTASMFWILLELGMTTASLTPAAPAARRE